MATTSIIIIFVTFPSPADWIDNVLAASNYLPAFYDSIVSLLIIGKLISHRSNARLAGPEESAGIYTYLAVVFFEASLLLSTTRVLYACLALTREACTAKFGPSTLVLGNIAAALSPLFMILRHALRSFKDPVKRRQVGGSPHAREDTFISDMTFAAPTRHGSTLRTILFGRSRGGMAYDTHEHSRYDVPGNAAEKSRDEEKLSDCLEGLLSQYSRRDYFCQL